MVKKKLVIDFPEAMEYIECDVCGKREKSERIFSGDGEVGIVGDEAQREGDSVWDVEITGNYQVVKETAQEIVVRPMEMRTVCPSCKS